MVNRRQVVEITLISAVAVALSCACIVLPHALRDFTRAGLDGRYFQSYYALFVPLLWFLFVVLVSAWVLGKQRTDRLWWWILVGVLAGYVGGVISITLVGLFHPGGWRLIVQQSFNLEEWLFRLAYPAVSLNCLEGLLVGGLAFCIYKYLHRVPPTTA
jgi:hypothetical protein